MRIILLDTSPIRRGAQVFFEDLADFLIEKQHNVIKIYLYEPNFNTLIKLNKDDKILNGNPKSIFEKFPTVHPILIYKLIKEINHFKPDIILLNGSRTVKYGIISRLFSRTKIKLVYRIIDSAVFWNKFSITKFYYRIIIKWGIDGAVGVSKASLNDMTSLYKFTKPSVVIHRSFNFQKTDNAKSILNDNLLNKKNNNPVLLFLGNLTKQKRPDRFLKILSELKKRGITFTAWIVGDGILKQELIEESKCLDLMNDVVFWGYKKNVFPFLQNADLLIITSDTEGLPGVAIEAGYFSVPTISSNVGGINEFIINNSIGLIVNDFSIDSYVKNVVYLLENKAERIQMGNKAKEMVESNFQLNHIGNSYIAFLDKILFSNEKN